MAEHNSEGTIVSVALVVMMICVVGSLSTGMGPVEFFFVGSVALLLISVITALVIAAIIAMYRMYQISQVEDGRSFVEKMKDEYNFAVLHEETSLVLAHLKTDIQTTLDKSPLYGRLSEAVNGVLERITTRSSASDDDDDDYDYLL